ncbi:hypothetical protein ONZ45_g14398 [Pleurotus djamor]|nr:hypothetical protein ONZ45_g14398 [Pleurotus djamor]
MSQNPFATLSSSSDPGAAASATTSRVSNEDGAAIKSPLANTEDNSDETLAVVQSQNVGVAEREGQCSTNITLGIAPNTRSQDEVPPWFEAAVHRALQPLEAQLREHAFQLRKITAEMRELTAELREARRPLAWSRNLLQYTPLLVVPFPDGTDPVKDLHLPAITSVESFSKLTQYQREEYFRGYYDGEEVPDAAQLRERVLGALGIKLNYYD